MSRIFAVLALSGLLFAHNPLLAQENRQAPGITVEGEAAINVVPDEVVISVGIESSDSDLQKVKRVNDERVARLRSVALANGIAAKDIRTDYINLTPNYSDRSLDTKRSLIDYTQRTTVVLTLRDVEKFESLMTGLLRSGVEYIHGVDFRTSELRKYRDQARVLAMKAAKEKAVALAGVLDQKVGKPKSIHEGRAGLWSNYGRWWGSGNFQQLSQNVVSQAPERDSAPDGALAPGMISVTANVTITFDLE